MKNKEQVIIETLESALIHASQWIERIEMIKGELPPHGWGKIVFEQAFNDLEEYKRIASKEQLCS